MDIETLKAFFFWCMIVNFGVYLFTVIAVLSFRDLICRLHGSLFNLDKPTVMLSLYKYLAAYKLLITVFSFTPWIALLIMT